MFFYSLTSVSVVHFNLSGKCLRLFDSEAVAFRQPIRLVELGQANSPQITQI
jgi:hypothetical protein